MSVTKYLSIEHILRCDNAIAAVKDKESRLIAAGPAFAKLFSFKHYQDAYGLSDFDLPNGVADIAEEYRQQDLKVLKSKKQHIHIDINKSKISNKVISLLTSKIPLLNEHDEAYGVFCHSTELSSVLVQNLLNIVLPKTNFLDRNIIYSQSYSMGGYVDVELTAREQECLFFLMRGKTASSIAALLGVSPKTIEKHVSNLKIKMDVYSKSQLIEKAISLGYFYNIPESLYEWLALNHQTVFNL